MSRGCRMRCVGALSLITGWLLGSIPCGAAIWTAGTSGLWTDSNTWGGGGVPSDTDDAIINNAITVTLNSATANLNSLTNNGVVVFVGTNTALQATTVANNGNVTHLAQSATNTVGPWIADNRVWIVCSNLTVAAAGTINANGKGYVAKTPSGGGLAGVGPGGGQGAGSDHGGGGSYGGVGGFLANANGGVTYGSAIAPTDPGSSGGSCYNYVALAKGGNGGGAIRIDASGNVTVNGQVTAIGDVGGPGGYTSGAGSGGSVFINCNTFLGSGAVRAAGGDAQGWNGYLMAAGGGGRIAVVYDPVAQSAFGPPSIIFDARGGWGVTNWNAVGATFAEPGSVYLTDNQFLTPRTTITNSFSLYLRDSTNWACSALTVTNAWVRFPTNCALAVTNTLTVIGSNAKLELKAPVSVQCSGIIVTNAASLYLYAGVTNSAWPTYGGLVTVNGPLFVATNSFIYVYSDAVTGCPVRCVVNSATVASGGTIDAVGKGYRGSFPVTYTGYGPGGGKSSDRSGGGGYGGMGGESWNNNPGGQPYGSSNAPINSGSCGGLGYGSTIGYGGGVIWLEAARELHVDGTLLANGADSPGYGGGGAGGSIYLQVETLSGTGQLLAKGGAGGPGASGNPGGGGGGGGRIATWTSFSSDWTGSYSVTGGPSSVNFTASRIMASNGTYVAGYVVPNRPGISNSLASNIGIGQATLNGYLYVTGRSDTAAAVYWGPSDQTTNAALWAYTNVFAAPQLVGQLFTNVTFPSTEQMYYYRFYAINGGGDFWTPATVKFLAGYVNFGLQNDTSYEVNLNALTVTVARASTATNGALTVYYTVGGTAQSGVNFNPLSGSVVIPDGAAQTNIIVQQLYTPVLEGNTTIQLSLSASNYLVGASNTVTLNLIDFSIPPGVNSNVNSGSWGNLSSWSIGRPPIPGDTVIIGTNMTLDQTVTGLVSLTVNAGQSLTFSGTNACVGAQNVTVYGTLTHITNTATASPWTPDGFVWVVCSNFTVAAGGVVNLDGRGYAGPTPSGSAIAGRGPGGGAVSDWAGGGGHGGAGGAAAQGTLGGISYDSVIAPVFPGSSGGAAHPYTMKSGNGGGVARIDATGDVHIDGLVTANGDNAPGPDGSTTCGAGAGGSVYITCRTLSGNGNFRAWGGTGNLYINPTSRSGAGGGGRIAIVYDTAAQAGVSPVPTMGFELRGGNGGLTPFFNTQPGSLYLSDASFFNPSYFTNSMYLVRSNMTTWTPPSAMVSNSWVRLQGGLGVKVVGDTTVTGLYAKLEFLAPCSFTGANLNVSGGGQVWFFAGPTNVASPIYGGRVAASGNVRIYTNSTIYPVCDPTNGGAVQMVVGNDLTVDAGGLLSANGYGYQGFVAGNAGMGPGGGKSTDIGSGGGYGGVGAMDIRGNAGGSTYGSSNAPLLAGSAGGRASGNVIGGGGGGGVVWLYAGRRVAVDGIISANGTNLEGNSGAGSGGSIYINVPHFSGGAGSLMANGGVGPGVNWAGGGGGGRIAVWRVNDITCTVSVTGGAGGSNNFPSGAGTIYWGQLPPPGSIFTMR